MNNLHRSNFSLNNKIPKTKNRTCALSYSRVECSLKGKQELTAAFYRSDVAAAQEVGWSDGSTSNFLSQHVKVSLGRIANPLVKNVCNMSL